MLGIPFELITMLGSGLLGGIMSLWSQSIKSKQAQHEMTISALSAQAGVHKEAREYAAPGFQFTRRIIAIAAVFAIIVWPKIVPVIWPEMSVMVGYTEWNPGFLFFEGTDEIKWQAAKGLVLTPLDTHLMSAIIGLYFGASIAKNAR
jgi:hypothetical protein